MTSLLVYLVLVIVVEFILLVYGERGWRDALDGWTRALDAWKETNQEWHDHCAKNNREWGEYCSSLIESYGNRCIGLGRKVDDLNEQLAAQAYVIGALKTQVRDSQQAGMTLQIAVAALYEQNEGLLARVKAHGKQQQEPYPEYQRLTAENEKLRKLLTWALHPEAHAALMAAYANAGKAVEGMDSNIPY
jgi:regulator of replication initiation timing